jgi:hypothetical protein
LKPSAVVPDSHLDSHARPGKVHLGPSTVLHTRTKLE